MSENKLKQFLPSVFSLLLLMGVISGISMFNLNQSNRLIAQEDLKVELQNKIDQLSVEANTTITRVKSQATGIDSDRVADDDEAVNTLMKKTFTWKSYDEYNKIRNDLMNDYNIGEDSSFMTVFMPEIINEVIEGKNYNRIDANGYNVTFNQLKSFVTDVNPVNGVYSYFTIVSVTSKSANGGTSDYELALEYKMDKESQIFEMVAYTLN